jgi:3-hydroxybutyryl-CoA dehydrogenase
MAVEREAERGSLPFRTVAVLGTGTMGEGIAYACALAGYRVRAFDPAEHQRSSLADRITRALDRGIARGKVPAELRDRTIAAVEVCADLESAVRPADLAIEAAPESLQVKQTIFGSMDSVAGDHVVLATNTSSLSISRIAGATRRPDRVLGLHFFNPVHRMRLLEVVPGSETSETTLALGIDFARSLGKETIVVSDTPGFATSRLGVVLGLEAIRMVEQGVASPADIDRAAELGYNHPMGPLRLTDLIGLDVRLGIAEYLWSELGSEQYRPPELLRSMVAAGHLGQKAGRGFYQWNIE